MVLIATNVCDLVDPEAKLLNFRNATKLVLYGWLTVPVKSLVQATAEHVREELIPKFRQKRLISSRSERVRRLDR